MRYINADNLADHKFTRESAKSSDYMRGWNDAIDAIVDIDLPHLLAIAASAGYDAAMEKKTADEEDEE